MSNFIYNKENPARICEDTMNEFFGLVTQGQTELFTNSIKDFYYICGIKFHKNGRNMKYAVNNFLKPTLSSPTKPDFEAGKTTLTKAQNRILEPKIKKFDDREEMMEDKLKIVFTILHGRFTESLLAKIGGYEKYEDIESDQDIIETMKLIKGIIFNFYENKELTHALWEAYVSVFRCRQHKFETNQDYFERFKNATSVIIQYYGPIRQYKGLIIHLGSKE